MKTIIILAHPDIEQSTINKSWIEALDKNNPDIVIHNIYTSYPDWKINVPEEQKLLEKFDRIIFQYPLFWYSTPPLLKKWMDEVLAYGWAYGSEGYKLADKELGLAVSTGGVAEAYTEAGYGTIEQILKPMEATAKFVNAKYIGSHIFHGALAPDVLDRLEVNKRKYVDFIVH